MEATLAAPHEGLAPKIRRVLLAAARCIWTWQERARERRHLEWLDERQLRDVGLRRCGPRGELARR